MAGIDDLDEILANLDVAIRDGGFVFVSLPHGSTDTPSDVTGGAQALITEDEGITAVLPADHAELSGFPDEPIFAWLTLTVHSSLEAVGLTAVFSAALAEAGLSCNVLAGFHHDHLLVPYEDRHLAADILRGLRG